MTSTGTTSYARQALQLPRRSRRNATSRLARSTYYHAKYSSLREGIHTHAIQRGQHRLQFAEFFSAAHHIDFAFVCIDQLPDGDSSRQDAGLRCALRGEGFRS